MFHNVLMTTLTPMSDKNEVNCWENRPFTSVWPESNNYTTTRDVQATKTIKKKNKRIRTAYSTEQLKVLERTYSRSRYIDSNRRKELAECLKIGERCIKVWFQNRRMKEKKESSESSDSSSDCFNTETVTPPPEKQREEYKFPNNNHNIPQNVESGGNEYKEKVTAEAQIPYYHYEASFPNFYVPYQSDFRNDMIYPPYYYPYQVPEYNNTNLESSGEIKQESENIWSPNTFDFNFF